MADDASILQWRGGCLEPYLEPGSTLLVHTLNPSDWSPRCLLSEVH